MSTRVRRSVLAVAVALAAGLQVFAAEDVDGAAQGGVAGVLAAQPPWSLRLPEEGAVPFRGVASFDSAGVGAGQFMYPAPNAAGLLAAVLTHGLLVDSAKRSQKEKLQEAADQVLIPYQPILEKFGYRELVLGALKKIAAPAPLHLVPSNEQPATEVWAQVAPVFAMTQDQSAIILYNEVSIHTPGGSYRKSIRVVSPPRKGKDAGNAWMAGGGTVLKEEAEGLLAASLDIAMGDAGRSIGVQDFPYKTIRYWEGGEMKMERAQLIEARCNRLVLRNLRGELMAVPPYQAAAVAVVDSCVADSK